MFPVFDYDYLFVLYLIKIKKFQKIYFFSNKIFINLN